VDEEIKKGALQLVFFTLERIRSEIAPMKFGATLESIGGPQFESKAGTLGRDKIFFNVSE